MSKKKDTEKKREELIEAIVTLRSREGVSLFNEKDAEKHELREFRPSSNTIYSARKALEDMGFEVMATGAFSLSISVRKPLFEKVFGVKLKQEKRKASGVIEEEYIHYSYQGKIEIPEKLKDLVDAIALPPPFEFLESEIPPTPSYHHLQLEDISKLLGVDGVKGKKVSVVIVDSGFFNHAYYKAGNYSVNVVLPDSAPSYVDRKKDWVGHGTAISSCLLAVAPKVKLTVVKSAYWSLYGVRVMTTAGFMKAVELKPDIISCSWGVRDDEVVGNPYAISITAEIRYAVEEGIAVVFAAGNYRVHSGGREVRSGVRCYPGTMPDVISVGGAYPAPCPTTNFHIWTASNYASSGESQAFPGRVIPDVCGIVGERPSGILIVEPTDPNCMGDQGFSRGAFPDKDETKRDDGWIVISGTSSAAPMVAGTIALMLEKCPGLRGNPSRIKQILKATATDITYGSSANNDNARVGPDIATGAGLVNPSAALQYLESPGHRAMYCKE